MPPILAMTELTPRPKFRIEVGNNSTEIKYENEYAPEMKNFPINEIGILHCGTINTAKQANPPSTINPPNRRRRRIRFAKGIRINIA